MTIKDIEKIQKEIDAKKKEKIQLERDIENIGNELKNQGINGIMEAEEKVETLKADIKKLKARENKLLKRLEDKFEWKSLK